jgi:FkbM family methyltransferase
MGAKRRAFEAAYRVAEKILGLREASALSCALAERLHPLGKRRVGDLDLSFLAPNSLVKWRVDTLLEKEPETIEWIDSFKEGEVFYDVGANIGLYSIYAAARRKSPVVAFEPDARNYALLVENAGLNGLSSLVRAYNVGLSDVDGLAVIYLSSRDAGSASNNIGAPIDALGKRFVAHLEQGILTFGLDSFVKTYAPPFPQHLKIDVDGLEPEIIRGAAKTLEDPRLLSVSLEVNEQEKEDLGLVPILEAAGLGLVHKKHAAMFEGSPYHMFYNYLFRRRA